MTKPVIYSLATFVAMLLFIIFFIIFAYTPRKTDRDIFAYRIPKLVIRSSQNMLCVPIAGNPQESSQRAFGELFKAFYLLRKSYPDLILNSPHARWQRTDPTNRNTWSGHYAIPLPPKITSIPFEVASRVPTATIAMWEYGKVGEVLQTGPYEMVFRAINTLDSLAFLSGLLTGNLYEEVYFKGPTLLAKGNKKKNKTLVIMSVVFPGERR